MVNSKFADEEKLYIRQYCEEMRFEEVRYQANTDFEEAANKLINISTDSELRIITLELMALIYSDNDYDNDEKDFMKKFVAKVGVSESRLDEIADLINRLSIVYGEINSFIEKG